MSQLPLLSSQLSRQQVANWHLREQIKDLKARVEDLEDQLRSCQLQLLHPNPLEAVRSLPDEV